MSRKLSYQMDDEHNDIVNRYEQFLAGKAGGYFDVEELETIVEFYFIKGKTKECTSVIDFGLKLHPHSDELKTKRAKIYLSAGDTSKALRILESVTQKNEYEPVLLKIEALTKLGKNKEAVLLANQLIEKEDDDLDNICLDIAFIFITQLNFEQAIYFLKTGDKFYNRNTDLLFELAFCQEQLLKTSEAIATYHRIVDIEPYTSEAWFNLGQIYFNLQQFNEALDAYEFAITINDDDSLTLLQKAHALFQLEKYPEAIEAYHEYDEKSEDKVSTQIFIGESYEKLELFDEAIKFYQNALESDSENYDALTGVGICLLEKEDFQGSLTFIQKAITVNEEAADAWVYLAEALIGLDDTDNALLAYLKSISLDPNQPDSLMAIANICMDKSEYQTALEYYLAAYELDKSLEFIELFISIAFYKINNLTSSKLYLKKAMELNLDAAKMFFEVCPDAIQTEFI